MPGRWLPESQELIRLQRALLRWYGEHRRGLPWRDEPTPYRVWVSEVMLQQTQVSRVVEYFEQFMERFPDVRTLAAAPLDDVLHVWQGLGYYARARALHRAAKMVAQQFGGEVPSDERQLFALPGIGRSTAGAILSIAFGREAPVLDANVARVLVRLAAIETPWHKVRSSARLWELANALLHHCRPCDRAQDKPGHWNQALMELGALVCIPRQPKCPVCPVSRWCQAFQSGKAGELPRRSPRRAKPFYRVAVGVILRRGRVLITQRPPEGLLGGLWEFPGGKVQPAETPEEALRRELHEELGLDVAISLTLTPVRHAYSHFRVELHPFLCQVPDQQEPHGEQPIRWVWPSQLARYAFASATRRILDKVRRQLAKEPSKRD